MNKDKWNSLPADVKKVFDDMRREQAEWTGKYVDDHVKEALTWSKGKYKDFQVFELPKSETAEIPKLMKPVIDAYVKKVNALGLPGDQIIKDIRKDLLSSMRTERGVSISDAPLKYRHVITLGGKNEVSRSSQ
jgi:TRAP-type C4-dicarboxylate transport system substrate-binding protein